VALYKTTITIILVTLLSLPRQGAAQETQEAFSQSLIAACQESDVPHVRELITAHRLWVKPLVNELISEYIHKTMLGNKNGARENKDAILLISQNFKDIHGENSLYLAYTYLDTWKLEQLGKKAQADRNYEMATELRLSGNHEEATVRYQRALQLYRDIGDLRGQGEVWGGLGFIYWYIDSDTCLHYYQCALKARTKADDKVQIGSMLNGIGSVYYLHFGELDSARHYYERAVEVREEIGSLTGLGASLMNLGGVYNDLSDLESALRSFERSYTIHQELGRQDMMAGSKLRSGTNLRQLGRYPEAMQDLETAKDLSLIIADTFTLADAYTQLALVYDNIGDYDAGIELVTTATGLYNNVDDQWGLAGAYNHTGIILQDAGRKKRAEEFYLKALEIYPQLDDQINVIRVLNNLGTVIFEQNDFIRAETYNRQALELSRQLEYKAGELPCLINLANTQNRLNQLDSAMRNYRLALELSREMNSPDSEWRALVGIAENYKLLGDYPNSIENNEKALSIIEDLRSTLHDASKKANYMARERYAFEDVIHMLATQHEKDPGKGYDLLAFEYAQRCKSRSFLEQIKGTDPLTVKEVQNGMHYRETVLLEYSLGDSSSVLWVITPDAYQMIRLPDRSTLEEQVESLRFALLDPEQDNKSFLLQSGNSLYRHLIQPAEKYLTKKSQITIMPDGILHYIPFEILITKEPKQGEDHPYEKLAYLGTKYALSYGQSSSVYLSMLNPSSSSETSMELKELVAFGDPVYADNYNRLEFSGEEINSIAVLFPKTSVDIFLQDDASEENAKKENMLPSYRYIHFATHGMVDENHPGRSGLVLSQKSNETEDGILRADEISGMKLNAELVVLSACQTGLGRMIRGEGMIGLSRSFMNAGAPAVVMSLWSVSDQSTNLLMTRFYENLIIKELSKADALQQARISLIKDGAYAHPFFWAPFVLTGGWL
jgi:CHAT domain-containing protein